MPGSHRGRLPLGRAHRQTDDEFAPDQSTATHDLPSENISERLQQILDDFQRDFDLLNRLVTYGIPDLSMASGSDRDLRQRFNRDPQPQSSNTFSTGAAVPGDPPFLPPLRSLGARARGPMASSGSSGSRSGRYRPADRGVLERHRSNVDARRLNTTGFDDRNRHIIEESHSQLRALLDFSNIMPPLPQGHDMPEESRRFKRRKLDSDRPAQSFKGFRYGKYGQVEPGQLNMEIVSCDGGLYSDEYSYPPENILKNDSSVYCTKGSRCNIVLRHQGTSVFSLKELIIKAPESKFSCPVREGMIFVAMESDELLTRTAQYQIQYLPGRPQRRGTVVLGQEDDDGSITRVRSRPSRAYSYGADDDDDDDDDDDEDDEDYRTAQIPPEFTAPPPPFSITTECSDEDSDAEHMPRSRPPRRRTPNRIGSLPFESDSSDESIDIWATTGRYRDWPNLDDIPTGTGTATNTTSTATAAARHGYPSSFRRLAAAREALRGSSRTAGGSGSGSGGNAAASMTLEEAQEASQIATQEAVRAVGGGELMTPLAHFHIKHDKSKCTVRFDPPVSGRYILLKMWSPHHLDDGGPPKNIDIQAVIAMGFAGPRYCPAVELA